MSPETQDTLDVAKEAKHDALHKRETQGLERDDPLEQAAAEKVEGVARELWAEERTDENKNSDGSGQEQSNEMEDLITL